MNNPPAFPTGNIAPDTFGMTLRDYFAAKALQGTISSSTYRIDIEETANWCYEMADAMLEAR
jgi:hypothetical protein